jgi:hypothetical protein
MVFCCFFAFATHFWGPFSLQVLVLFGLVLVIFGILNISLFFCIFLHSLTLTHSLTRHSPSFACHIWWKSDDRLLDPLSVPKFLVENVDLVEKVEKVEILEIPGLHFICNSI